MEGVVGRAGNHGPKLGQGCHLPFKTTQETKRNAEEDSVQSAGIPTTAATSGKHKRSEGQSENERDLEDDQPPTANRRKWAPGGDASRCSLRLDRRQLTPCCNANRPPGRSRFPARDKNGTFGFRAGHYAS